MADSDVEMGSAADIGNRRLRMDQKLATATRGRVQLVSYIFFHRFQIVSGVHQAPNAMDSAIFFAMGFKVAGELICPLTST
jgi:hypothetical protein